MDGRHFDFPLGSLGVNIRRVALFAEGEGATVLERGAFPDGAVGDAAISWPTTETAEILLTLRPAGAGKAISCKIILTMTNNG